MLLLNESHFIREKKKLKLESAYSCGTDLKGKSVYSCGMEIAYTIPSVRHLKFYFDSAQIPINSLTLWIRDEIEKGEMNLSMNGKKKQMKL